MSSSKKEIILSINPCIYGLNHHDPSVALISDGKIVFAVEEERTNGIKGSKGIFPINSIKVCLDYCDLEWEDVTNIAIGYDPHLWKERLNLELMAIIRKHSNLCCAKSDITFDAEAMMDKIVLSNLVDRYKFFKDDSNIDDLILDKSNAKKKISISYFEHHLSHIASSYEVSGFENSVGIVVDGIGETASTTIWKIIDHHYEKILQLNYPNSLGYFYALATKFLGFEPWHHQGKTMALAAYGHYNEEICFKLKKVINTSSAFYDISSFIDDNSTEFLMLDEEKAVHSLEEILGFPARNKCDPITKQHEDFAWAVQNILETSV